MPRSLSLLGVLFCIATSTLTLAGCGQSYDWNQKITVEVDTPDGAKSGSSVMHVRWNGGIPGIVGDAKGARFELNGEAVSVKLGEGRFLIANLDGMQEAAYNIVSGGRGPIADYGGKIETLDKNLILPIELYPTFVTFSNIGDPKTMQKVNPKNISLIFGSGYSIKKVTLEITDEEVTVGNLQQVLTWLHDDGIEAPLNDGRSETLRYPDNSSRGYGTVGIEDLQSNR